MTWDEVCALSLEQMELLLAAAARRNARRTLAVAGATAAGMCDANAWRRVAGELQEQARAGL